MDGTQLGVATASLMEKVERVYGEQAEIVDAVVLAEVTWTDEDGEERSAIDWFCTSERSVVREGLLAVAVKAGPFVQEGGPS